MKKKMGWTAFGIVGFIFTPMGALFLLLGALMRNSKAVSWQSTDDPVIFQAVFGGLGLLFAAAGLVFLFLDLRRRMLQRRAYNEGTCVEAEILGTTTISNMNTLNGHPCMLECAWTDANGVVHVYKSRYLYTNVSKLLKSKTVPVYIDRYNENIGFVDVDAVLPEIRVH